MKKRRIVIALILLTVAFMPMLAEGGLNVVLLGDSNTWLGGDDCTGPRGWSTWFREAFQPATCSSYARSGATWTCTPRTRRNTTENIGILGDDNVIYNQIARLTEAASVSAAPMPNRTDSVGEGPEPALNVRASPVPACQPMPHIIIIMCGTNDAWFRDQRPHAFEMSTERSEALAAKGNLDSSATSAEVSPVPVRNVALLPPNELLTIEDAVENGICLLRQAFPQARIVLITPMPSTAVPQEFITLAGDIIEATAKRINVSPTLPSCDAPSSCISPTLPSCDAPLLTVIRLDRNSCFTADSERRQRHYTYDGTHTSEAGAQCIGRHIADVLSQQLFCNKKFCNHKKP